MRAAATVTISFASAFVARIVLATELRRIVGILNDSKKTFGGFGPVPGQVEYWTTKCEEITAALRDIATQMGDPS